MARGSIRKRESGNYAILYYDNDGKRHWKTLKGANKKDAERVLNEITYKAYRGEYFDKEIGFSDLTTKWLESRRPEVKPSTIEFYENISKHLKSNFKHKDAKKVDTESVEAYISEKLKRLAPSTVGYHLGMLRSIFDKAMQWKYVNSNPTRGLKKPRLEHKEIEILNELELKKLINLSKDQTKLLITTALYTGMRAGELMALRWEEIDLVEGTIRVTRNCVRGIIGTPKSRGSKRTIVIPPLLVDELAKAKNDKSELVFTNGNGKYLDWNNFYKREFLRLLKEAGIPKVKFHSLRHSYASTLLSSGMDLKFVQEQLGHTNLTMTLDTYSHLLPSRKVGAGKRIEEAFRDIFVEDKVSL